MKRWFAAVLLAGSVLLALPAGAQIQWFGYVLGGEDDALAATKNYTNFTHIVAVEPEDAVFRQRVDAISQRGLKVTIDLGRIFWCGPPQYDTLCGDWQTRWQRWKTYNSSILTPAKVLAVTVRDEPLLFGSSLTYVETAAALIKSDAALASWLKIFYVESGCKIVEDVCGQPTDYNNGFNNATGNIPSIDWIGINVYAVRPLTDWNFNTARDRMRVKFPGRKWIYIADGWWDPGHEQAFPGGINFMATIAREWYDVARADPNAVLLGMFAWDYGDLASKDFPCSVLQEHIAIGREITGKHQGSPPIGSYSIDTLGVVTGWHCDPDQTVCDLNPRMDIRVDGTLAASFYGSYGDTPVTNLQCGTDKAFRFKFTLPRSSQTKTISVTSDDADTSGITVASTCPQSPSCIWVSHLKYFGYSGSADDTANRGLNETKGFTNFSHVVQGADPASTFVRDRVTAMNARGVKGAVDLGQLLWCGTNYRSLCTDWQARWNTWKTTNASILAPDKLLALVVRAEPFNYNVSMSHYELATAHIKADPTVGSWIRLWLVEAPCVIANNNCGAYPGSNAWNNYTGSLPSVDWVGLNAYAIHPATDPTYQTALTRMKNRFPSKPRLYVMDGYWDSSHATTFGATINVMRGIADEWYDLAHNDPAAILLGIYSWPSFGGGVTGSRDFPCHVLSRHRDIGREITLKTRPNTAAPIGLLENIYDGSGLAVGYACDPDGSICEDPVIDFYADGVYSQTTTNYPSRTDYVTNAQCGVGVAYRYRYNLSPSASGRNVRAFARDLASGGTWLPSSCAENPACLWFKTSYDPKGYMEVISPGGVAAGWVCDPDAPHLSTQVRLATANGTPIGTYTTNLASEQAVADACQGGYLHRFSVQLPAWARYNTIRAFALDTVSGEAQIPWLCDGGAWECTWY